MNRDEPVTTETRAFETNDLILTDVTCLNAMLYFIVSFRPYTQIGRPHENRVYMETEIGVAVR